MNIVEDQNWVNVMPLLQLLMALSELTASSPTEHLWKTDSQKHVAPSPSLLRYPLTKKVFPPTTWKNSTMPNYFKL